VLRCFFDFFEGSAIFVRPFAPSLRSEGCGAAARERAVFFVEAPSAVRLLRMQSRGGNLEIRGSRGMSKQANHAVTAGGGLCAPGLQRSETGVHAGCCAPRAARSRGWVAAFQEGWRVLIRRLAAFVLGIARPAGAGAGLARRGGCPAGLWLPALLLGGAALVAAPAQLPLRVNAGGGAVVDARGQTWLEDSYYSGGFTYAAPNAIAGTGTPALYQTERAGLFSYQIPLPPGRYQVTLHFAEIYYKNQGKRVFSVNAEGVPSVVALDIVAAAGPNAANAASFEVEVSDGVLSLDFVPMVENPKLSALEVALLRSGAPVSLRVDAPAELVFGPSPVTGVLEAVVSGFPQTAGLGSAGSWEQTDGPAPAAILSPGSLRSGVGFPSPGVYTFRFPASYSGASAAAKTKVFVFGEGSGQENLRIRAGGPAYTDASGRQWRADAFYKGGDAFSVPQSVKGTQDPPLYQRERYGAFGYRIPVQNGSYLLRLHLAEIWFKSAGSRLFDVFAEGLPVVSGLDVVQAAGPLTALVLNREVRVSDGFADLNFVPVKNNAKISALELLPLSLDAPPTGLSLGPERTLQLPDNAVTVEAVLSGPGAGVAPSNWRWTQLAGPAQVSIDPEAGSVAKLRFDTAGSYRFRAEVNVSGAPVSAELSVVVLEGAPPPLRVQTLAEIRGGPVPAELLLEAQVFGVPAGAPTAWSGLWEQTSGPAPVKFINMSAPVSRAVFPEPGVYSFKYTVKMGPASASSSLVVRAQGDVDGQEDVRIHSGGVAYTDSRGRSWLEDQFFSGGAAFGVFDPVQGTADPGLYQTERFGSFGYHIPVRNGLYNLRLHFAELWFKRVGDRMFGVSAEGAVILRDLDVYKSSGFLSAMVWSGMVHVKDGRLDLEFLPWKDSPVLCALEVLPVALDPPSFQLGAGPDRQLQLPLDTVRLEVQALEGSSSVSGASCEWSQVSGPSQAGIAAPASFATDVHFSSAGLYKFRARVVRGGTSGEAAVAVQVRPAADPPGTLRIRCGGGGFVDSGQTKWSADVFYNGGFSYASSASIAGSPDAGLYQSERAGKQFGYRIPLPAGDYTVRLHFAEIYWKNPGSRVFSVAMEGKQIAAALDLCASPGPGAVFVKEMLQSVTDGFLDLDFAAQKDNAKVSAIEILPAAKVDHLMHADIRAPEWVVDYSGAGGATVVLQGSDSHTHELGRWLTRFEWREGQFLLSSKADFSVEAPVGEHRYTLTVWDSKTPPASMQESVTVRVLPASAVDGAAVHYYSAPGSAASGSASPRFVSVSPAFRLERGGDGMDFGVLDPARVVFAADWKVGVSGRYAPRLPQGAAGAVLLNGSPWVGERQLEAGRHSLVWSLEGVVAEALPLELAWMRGDGASGLFSELTHDETRMPPQINRMPSSGPALGGDLLEIEGMGFFPAAEVAVYWGGRRLGAEILESSPQRIRISTPPGTGTVGVQIRTPQGTSNAVGYSYVEGTAPVQFLLKNVMTLPSPTQAAWGPDGRLYVASLSGSVTALELDDQYNVIRSQFIPAVQGFSNNQALGIGFSPWEPPLAFKIYLSHAKLFVTGGVSGIRPAPYLGEVSALAAPKFMPVSVLSGLPSSNHDHGVNGIAFDNLGQLYVPQGGNTNAGVPDPRIGGLDESPLSETVVLASVRRPDFDGRITYRDFRTGAPLPDQNDGLNAEVAGGAGVRTFVSGLRNAFDLVWATNGRLYGTDNGPNDGFGAASLGASVSGPEPAAMDKVLLLARGRYYGHANRSRGRFDPRENYYRDVWDSPGPAWYTPPLVDLPSSKDGIDEYRATTFGGALRGSLLVQEWNENLAALKLSADGRRVESVTKKVPGTNHGLDVVCGPGGAILVVDYSLGQLNVALPQDKSAAGMVAYDIFPWRAPAAGGFQFVIGGQGFGTMADTSVRFGSLQAVITSVGPRRIKGMIPAAAAPTAGFLPVQVQSGGGVSVIPEAFRYLLAAGEGAGVWKAEVSPGIAPGACSCAEAGGVVYVISEDGTSFQAFDCVAGRWWGDLPLPALQVRRGALVAAGAELVLVGSVADGAPLEVQSYDPLSRVWSRCLSAPSNALRPAVASIGRFVYLVGGEVAGAAVKSGWKLDLDRKAWSALPGMPFASAESAVCADGGRLYVIGGVPGDAFLRVQVYDSAAGFWSQAADSSGQAPANRFGAAAAMFSGECYVFGGRFGGGELSSRVDALLVEKMLWRAEANLPEPAWGLGVAPGETEILVVGGRGSGQALREARNLVR